MKKDNWHEELFNQLLRPSRSLVIDPTLDLATLRRADLFTFVFIRHPFERLVSAYHDKFIVQKNNAFMTALLNYNREHKLVGSMPSFELFVNFVVDEITTDSMSDGSLHWWPYSKICKICEMDYSYVGRIEVRYHNEQIIPFVYFKSYFKCSICFPHTFLIM